MDRVAAGAPAALNALRTAVTGEEAGRIAVDGIEAGRFLILTESDELDSHRSKAADYDAWVRSRGDQLTAELGGAPTR
jgi:hypothetical protein